MKKKHTAQSAFGNHCIFIGVLAFVTGILLALFASAESAIVRPPCAHGVWAISHEGAPSRSRLALFIKHGSPITTAREMKDDDVVAHGCR